MRRAESSHALAFPAPPAWLKEELKKRREFADAAVCERIWQKLHEPHANKLYMKPMTPGYDVNVENLLPNGKYGDKVLLVPGQIFATPESLLRDGLNLVTSSYMAACAVRSWGEVRAAHFGSNDKLEEEEVHALSVGPQKRGKPTGKGKGDGFKPFLVWKILPRLGHSLIANVRETPVLVSETPPGSCVFLGLQQHVDHGKVTVTSTDPFFSIGSSLCSMTHRVDFRLPGLLSLLQLPSDNPENGKLWMFFNCNAHKVRDLISKGSEYQLTLFDIDSCISVWQPLGYTVFIPMGFSHCVSTFFHPHVHANAFVTVSLGLTWALHGNIDQMRKAHAHLTNDRLGYDRNANEEESYTALNLHFNVQQVTPESSKMAFKKAAGILTKKDKNKEKTKAASAKRHKK